MVIYVIDYYLSMLNCKLLLIYVKLFRLCSPRSTFLFTHIGVLIFNLTFIRKSLFVDSDYIFSYSCQPAVLCATKILLFFGLIYNDLERIYRGKSSQSRNWGMQLYLFDKQPWKMKDNIYSFRVCNFCYGGQRMQSWHG